MVMQPPARLPQLVITMLASMHKWTGGPQLREHLLRASLLFIASLRDIVQDVDKVSEPLVDAERSSWNSV